MKWASQREEGPKKRPNPSPKPEQAMLWLWRRTGPFMILFQIFARSQPQEKVLLSFQPKPRGGVLLSSRPTYLIAHFLLIKL